MSWEIKLTGIFLRQSLQGNELVTVTSKPLPETAGLKDPRICSIIPRRWGCGIHAQRDDADCLIQ